MEKALIVIILTGWLIAIGALVLAYWELKNAQNRTL
jgi:hypothetical protein